MLACCAPLSLAGSEAIRTTPAPGRTAPAATEAPTRVSEITRKLITFGLDFLSTTPNARSSRYGKDYRHRSRHDQQLHGRARGRRADRDPERRGRPHDAVRRRVHEGRSAARRRPGPAPA